MKFLALTLLIAANTASAKINFTAGVVRGDNFNNGLTVDLELNQRELCYQDETAYIESEMIEETNETVVMQFTISTKNESGTYMVRGLPKLSFTMNPENKTCAGSLRCDGPSETFTLMATVQKIEEAAPVAEPAE